REGRFGRCVVAGGDRTAFCGPRCLAPWRSSVAVPPALTMRLATPLCFRTTCFGSALLAGVLAFLPVYPLAQEVDEFERATEPPDERVAVIMEAFEEGDCDALLDLT